MHRFYRMILLTLCLSLLLPFCSVGPALAEEEGPGHIFIVNVDGLSYEAFISTPVSNLKHLAGEGVLDEKSLAICSDTGEEAQASLLTGAPPEQHKYYSANDRLEMASVLDMLKRGEYSFMVVDDTGGKLKAFDYGEKHYFQVDTKKSDREVVQEAIKHFKEQDSYFNYISLNDCMEALLSLDDRRYNEAILAMDQAVGDLLAYLRQENIYYDSMIIVTSARSSSPSHLVPLIMQGKGCKTGIKITDTMIIDIAPTVCHLSGVKPPYGSRGIPIYDALTGSGTNQAYIRDKWINALKSDRTTSWKSTYSLREELYRCYHQIASMKEERQSMFDFAGDKEDLINSLKSRITVERIVWGGLVLVMLLGYGVEYFVLKRKFLLFR